MSTSSMTAATTMAPRVASGSCSKSPVRKSRVMTVRTATKSPETCDLRPGAAVDRRLGEAAVDDHAGRQTGAGVGGAEAEELLVGVDVVAGARRVGLGGAETLGEADRARRPRRDPPRLEVVVEADAVGEPERGQAGRRWCRRSRHPCSSRLNSVDERGRRARRRRANRAPRGNYRRSPSTRPASEDAPTSERRPVGVAEGGRRGPRASRRSCRRPSTPNSLGNWPMMMVSARPTMKPLSTGSEMNAREEAEPQQAGDERDARR